MSHRSRTAFHQSGDRLIRGICSTAAGVRDVLVGVFHACRGTCIVIGEALAERRRAGRI